MNFPLRSYSSKVLLFGEHTVLMGSGALAIPYNRYHGRWIPDKKISYQWWKPFLNYIIGLKLAFLNEARLEFLMTQDNFFLNIPIGYGLGSSGALTAAIYDFTKADDESELAELQRRLGLIESFFHGKSSGYDPLISFLDRGIQKSASGETSFWTPNYSFDFHCYLLDSGSARVGKNLISQVQQYASDERGRFDKIVDLNNKIISSLYEEADTDFLFMRLNQLSVEQFDKMNFLILPNIQDLWKSTLELDNISLKVCGAGGGGYYLLFSKTTISDIQGFNLQEVPLG